MLFKQGCKKRFRARQWLRCHSLALSLLFMVCGLMNITSYAAAINVYLKFNDATLTQEITNLNQYLEEQGIFSRYQFEPFLAHHPLHITLYLTAYPADQLERIKAQVMNLVKYAHAVTIKTAALNLSVDSYLMLDVNNSRTDSGKNNELQQMSDEFSLRLSQIRDFQEKIPDWANAIPEKKKAFELYGSPNVFFEYNPHFTIFAKNFSDPSTQKAFQAEMTTLLSQYTLPEIEVSANEIGIGYVDDFGQITEEIASFRLSH